MSRYFTDLRWLPMRLRNLTTLRRIGIVVIVLFTVIIGVKLFSRSDTDGDVALRVAQPDIPPYKSMFDFPIEASSFEANRPPAIENTYTEESEGEVTEMKILQDDMEDFTVSDMDSEIDFSTPATTVDPYPESENPTWDVSYNVTAYYEERKNTSCYLPMNPVYYFSRLYIPSDLEKRGCMKRLPKVIIAGIRKCGTGTLMRFLNLHPHVAVTNYEIHYFDNNYREQKSDPNWYQDQMQYTSSRQIPIEKTPTYFFRPYDAPQLIRKTLTKDVKIIVMLCDPIHRAVSDYLEFVAKYRKMKSKLNNIYSRKYLARTFEQSVFSDNREVQVYNEIVDVGLYVKYIHRWIEYFPMKQLLFLDGEVFKSNPAAELRKVEDFLDLKHFFRKEHFYFDENKGFYCANYPQPSCMNASKGREHPEVDPKVLKALCKFYTPYDNALENTLRQTFKWVGKCQENMHTK